jgi:hypothetical protein
MYTDGLVESRDRSVADGMELLRRSVAELAGAGLDELVDGVLERLVPGHHEDDVALVAIRLHRQDRPRPPEAGPNRVLPTPQPPGQVPTADGDPAQK